MNNRWLIVVLICSIAVNLLFIGIAVGRFTRAADARPFPPHLGWIGRDLTAETQQTLRGELRQFAKQGRQLRRQLMQKQRAVNEAFMSEPLDETRIREQLTELAAASAESQGALHEALVTIMSKLNVEERKLALDRLQRTREGEMRRRRGPRERAE